MWGFSFMASGRPSKFSQEKADIVCLTLKEGGTLRAAAKAADVSPSTVLSWVDQFPSFSEQYAGARQIGYQLLADEIIEISDDSAGDVIVDDEGNTRTDAERVARSRLRVDTRKWMLSKMLPKIYGDKMESTVKGEMTIRSAKELTEEELAAIAAGSR